MPLYHHFSLNYSIPLMKPMIICIIQLIDIYCFMFVGVIMCNNVEEYGMSLMRPDMSICPTFCAWTIPPVTKKIFLENWPLLTDDRLFSLSGQYWFIIIEWLIYHPYWPLIGHLYKNPLYKKMIPLWEKSVIWKTEIGWKILCLGNWCI